MSEKDYSPPAAAAPKLSNEKRPSAAENARALFLNRLRSLFNIDGHLLPELAPKQQLEFIRDPVRYAIRTDKPQMDAIWREIEKRQTDKVTEDFLDRSARCAIRALMSLEATAKMLERWGPECFPPDEQGRTHFAGLMMESAAEAIREAFANAIKQVEGPRVPAAIAELSKGAAPAHESKSEKDHT